MADFFPDWNTAWVAGDFVRACAWVFGVLEYGGAAAGIFAYAVEMAVVLYLPEIDLQYAGMALAASVIMLIPAVFVFFMGQDYLEQGIVASGMKE